MADDSKTLIPIGETLASQIACESEDPRKVEGEAYENIKRTLAETRNIVQESSKKYDELDPQDALYETKKKIGIRVLKFLNSSIRAMEIYMEEVEKDL